MTHTTYLARRGQLQTYFDRTAVEAWARLTSDAPVSRIRATVRAGRDAMRQTILDWLPADLSGVRVLDAGCGTGALAVEAAKRGASVVAIDLSPNLVALARDRMPVVPGAGRIEFRAGDMLDLSLGRFDYAVAMDSLIHYRAADMADAVARLASRVDHGIIFTFAPRTPALTLMHAAGKLFPRGDKSPAIEPVGCDAIAKRLRIHPALAPWHVGRTHRVSSGFYISQALEIVR
jgi:magnesium-protoporphyrin O-methyltransferase